MGRGTKKDENRWFKVILKLQGRILKIPTPILQR